MSAYPTLKAREAATVERMQAAVAELKPALAAYARDHGGRFVLFGSAARREMREDSDVDIFVDFPAGAHMGAISFAEDTCWRLGLKPDILGFWQPSGRLRARLDAEGLILPGEEGQWSSPMTNEDRWGDLLDAARSAASHFRAAEEIFNEGRLETTGSLGYRARMAFYHAMQSGHTALESALKRALAALGQRLPSGSEWHKALIREAARPLGPGGPVLSPELAAAADETREFRHFASHSYDAPFDPQKARPAVDAGRILADRIEGELAALAERNKRA